MTFDHRLEGCRPTPLASYLKALGILRLVAEHKDPDAKGWWRAERFHLRTKLSADELVAFFLNDYAPSPIIAPWNGGSGFYFQEGKSKEKDPTTGKKIKTGKRDQATEATKTLEAIASSKDPRFDAYSQIICEARALVQDLGFEKAPSSEDKKRLIIVLRRSIEEEALLWLDASLALTTDAITFPPLLGTGGNDGNLDFTSNYMQRLAELFGANARLPQTLLDAAIFNTTAAGLTDSAVGQFAPGDAGGPNSTSGVEGGATLNPWDFVFMLEGALAVAGGVVRRFSADDRSAASFPFTVRATGAGFGTASQPEESEARGEFWAPIWSAPSGLGEVKALFREGRIAQTRRSLKDGMDAALAIATVGADRRISAYQRYGFQKRQGLAFLATPLERRAVVYNPATDLVADLDKGRWLDRVRRIARSDRAPARFTAAVQSLEEALFALAGERGASRSAAAAIISLGEIVRTVAPSKSLREEVPPQPLLRHEWIAACGDSAEVHLAAALSGLWLKGPNDEDSQPTAEGPRNPDEFPFPFHIAPLAKDKQGNRKRRCRTWSEEGSSPDCVWTEGSLVESMIAVALRRSVEATRTGAGGGAFAGSWPRLASLADVVAFINGDVDDALIADLALGFAWVDAAKDGSASRSQGRNSGSTSSEPLPLAYAAIKPLFTPQSAKDDESRKPMKFAPTIAPLLAAGRIGEAVETAMARARADGLPAPFTGLRPVGVNPRRLLASLLFPISERALQSCQTLAYPADEKERPNEDAA